LMNRTRIIILVLLIAVVFAGIIYAQNDQGSRPRWEYMGIINRMINIPGAFQEFNEAGKEGWELVVVSNNIYIFKRRLP
ncbi:MAG: hypothetical protein LBQ93_10145, partial [Treponema sp.]|nr:hypothetical protein [Treponema sp.]